MNKPHTVLSSEVLQRIYSNARKKKKYKYKPIRKPYNIHLFG